MSTGGERVLIVDDVLAWREILVRLLRRSERIGEIRVAGSLGEAATAIDSLKPTVVITDIRLSAENDRDLSGLDVCRIARESDPDIGLVVLSGHGTVGVVRRALRDFEADDFVLKGELEPDAFISVILRAAS